MDRVVVKEEEITIPCDAGTPSVQHGPASSSSSNLSPPQPMEGLHDGFRKVNPDRLEFANERFLGGQKHLLKTIKRKKNVTQNVQQQGGSCIEIGDYGLDGEIERLKRDRSVLMAEIVKLRQQQQFSRDQLLNMEARLQLTERKQQQMMTFVAKALTNPAFVQNLMQQNEQRRALGGIRIGRKRRLPASTSTENLFSATLDDKSSSDTKAATGADLGDIDDLNWEELLNEDLMGHDQEGDQNEDDELASKVSSWGEDLQDFIDQMGFVE